jgi:hypothetical protein
MAVVEMMSRYSREEEDLRWYFTESEGAQGLRSNFPGVIFQIMLGGGAPSSARTEPDPFGLASAERARHIRRRLEALDEYEAQALRVVFGEEPPKGLDGFGRASALVPLSRRAIQAWIATRTSRGLMDWLSRLERRTEEPDIAKLFIALRDEAEGGLSAALAAYRDARRKGVAHAQ